MNTRKKIVLNTGASLLYQIVTVAYGFIIPRLIITNYGSDMNGWLSSIVKFLSLISVCEFGIGSVIKANFYKPLYENDTDTISRIVKSANRFFYRVGLFFLIYTILLIFMFPVFKSNTFGFKDTTLMIIVVSLGTFSQYFFGMSSQLLLEADQKGYINYFIGIVATTIITICSIILMSRDFSLLSVRLIYAIVFTVRPICLFLYAKREYRINTRSVILNEEPIKQKWNGFSLHIAQIVQNNTDTLVLTICSVVSNVSIYNIYHLVTNGLSVLVNMLGQSLTPVFGQIFASGNTNSLRKHFDRFEWLMHCFISCIFSTCAVSIISFVEIYTRGVADTDYIHWDFGILLSAATGLYCVSQLYLTLINSTGRFKETEKFIVLEPIINIVLSVATVNRYGLVGVTIGTIVSLVYKTVYLVIYLQKNIMRKRFRSYLCLVALDTVIITSIVFASKYIIISDRSYLQWFISVMIIGLVGLIVSGITSLFLYSSHIKWVIFEAKSLIKRDD